MHVNVLKHFYGWPAAVILFMFFGCGATPDIPVNTASTDPGTSVTFKGSRHSLLGAPIRIGETLPSVQLVEAEGMTSVDLSKERGSILFLSIVPSLDTKVCDAQTHKLGEDGDELPETVRRVTISRDTPFAQKRFAEESGLTDIRYLSDYKRGDFGRAMGLLVEDLMLLARSVIIVDETGVARYIQVVPELTELPDMERAFREASKIAAAK